MITKKQFIKAYNLLKDLDEFVNELSDLKIDIIESKLFNGYNIFDILVDVSFTEEGADIISWYVYEDCPHYIEEKDGTRIDFFTIDDVWDYLVKNNYVKK